MDMQLYNCLIWICLASNQMFKLESRILHNKLDIPTIALFKFHSFKNNYKQNHVAITTIYSMVWIKTSVDGIKHYTLYKVCALSSISSWGHHITNHMNVYREITQCDFVHILQLWAHEDGLEVGPLVHGSPYVHFSNLASLGYKCTLDKRKHEFAITELYKHYVF